MQGAGLRLGHSDCLGLKVFSARHTCKSWETWYVLVRDRLVRADLGFSCTFIEEAKGAEVIFLAELKLSWVAGRSECHKTVVPNLFCS